MLAAWNAGVTAVLGTAAGYGIVRHLNSMGDDTWVWRFPGPYLVGYGVAAVLLPLLISAVILHFLEKKTVVEQLRDIN